MTFEVKRDFCSICSKTVYPVEKIAADDKILHKTCLRCLHCNKVLSLGNYAALNGGFYCKPHFKQLFALKGNYSDGFKTSGENLRKSSDSKSSSLDNMKSNLQSQENFRKSLENLQKSQEGKDQLPPKSPSLTDVEVKSLINLTRKVSLKFGVELKSSQTDLQNSLKEKDTNITFLDKDSEIARLKEIVQAQEKEIASLKSKLLEKDQSQ